MTRKPTAATKPQPGKRGPKGLTAAEPAGPQLDTDSLASRSQELVTMGEHQRAVVEQFGSGLPWHPDHYEAAIRGELRRGCEAFLRAGSYLIVARECTAHGEWRGMLTRLGVEESQARRMMEATRRVAGLPNRAMSHDLVQAVGNQSKLIELLSLPEDQFAELAEKGSTGGLEVDEIEGMTVGELRAAVREARADIAAKDQRITKISDDLNKSEEKAVKAQRKWKASTPDEQQVALEKRVIEAKHELIANIGTQKAGLTAAVLDLANHCNEHDLDCAQFLGDMIGELLGALRELRDGYEFGFAIPVVNDREG